MSVFQSDTVRIEQDNDGSQVLLLDVPGRPVNLITRQVLADLEAAFDHLATLERVPVLVIRSGKKAGFLAGADIKEFTAIREASAAVALSETGQRVFGKLAKLKMPSVAVVHGACLGGGLELALACDYRLIFDKSNTQLGLPEVELGLLPGWGGTQRLPRIIGLEAALQVILTGRRLSAMQAYRNGLADAYAASEAELRDQYTRLLVRAVSEGKRHRDRLPLRGWRQRLLESNAFGRRLILRGTERLIRSRVPDDMPAPLEALEAVRIGIDRGLEVGLQREREAAGRLALSGACKNLVHLFFQRENARKLPAGMESARAVKRVGVVGAGIMGAGIAQLAALNGCEVVVQEMNAETLAAGLARIDDLFQKATGRGKLTPEDAKTRRAAIKGTTTREGFESLDLVIEAAVENLELKQNLFRDILRDTAASCVVATNTSSLAVGKLQEGRPADEAKRIGGLHFFNPVHKMPLVEVVRGKDTTPETLALLTRFAIDLGKTPVVVGDGPGFVVNRVLMPYLDEAVRLVAEGMSIKEVDRVMKRFGMPSGPLELLDQIGLDVAAHVGKLMKLQLGELIDTGNVFDRMTKQGWLGQKSKRGFYLHGKKSLKPHRQARNLVREAMPAKGESPTPDEARERMVLVMVNEAARAVERKLADAETVDLAMVFGTGWAPHRGGPLKYADDRGLPGLVKSMEALAVRLGGRFAPCAELKRRGVKNERFRPTE